MKIELSGDRRVVYEIHFQTGSDVPIVYVAAKSVAVAVNEASRLYPSQIIQEVEMRVASCIVAKEKR